MMYSSNQCGFLSQCNTGKVFISMLYWFQECKCRQHLWQSEVVEIVAARDIYAWRNTHTHIYYFYTLLHIYYYTYILWVDIYVFPVFGKAGKIFGVIWEQWESVTMFPFLNYPTVLRSKILHFDESHGETKC